MFSRRACWVHGSARREVQQNQWSIVHGCLDFCGNIRYSPFQCSRPFFFFYLSCTHKVTIDISSPWLRRECPVNATALIAPFNNTCTADFCRFYVVIKQKSICLHTPPTPLLFFFWRFSTCKPSADQMVSIYFAQGSLKASHYNTISHFSLASALKFSLALLYSLRLTSTCPKARAL